MFKAIILKLVNKIIRFKVTRRMSKYEKMYPEEAKMAYEKAHTFFMKFYSIKNTLLIIADSDSTHSNLAAVYADEVNERFLSLGNMSSVKQEDIITVFNLLDSYIPFILLHKQYLKSVNVEDTTAYDFYHDGIVIPKDQIFYNIKQNGTEWL